MSGIATLIVLLYERLHDEYLRNCDMFVNELQTSEINSALWS